MTFLLLLVFCYFLIITSTANTKETSRSYFSVLNRVVPCENPSLPYANDSRGLLEISVKNNIMKGNFTILGKNTNLQATVQDSYYIDGKWQTTFYAKNLSCRSQWVAMLLKFVGVQYDKKTCAVPKGSHVFEVDYNKLDHVWITMRDYGRMMRRVEVHNKAGTMVCCEFQCDIKPVN